MHPGSHRLLRRVSILGLLMIIIGLVAVSLTQCTMVDDNVTGVSFSKAKADKCLKDCSKDYDQATKKEFQLNRKNRRQCDGDILCLAKEQERHREAQSRIDDEYTECRSECHHQGGGGSR